MFTQKQVYLDNSSTTKPCEQAVSEMLSALSKDWGNPSSLHGMGVDAQIRVSRVRAAVANTLHCREDEIFFTSGGTESNNTALSGAAHAAARRGKKIVTTAVEHPSVLEPLKRLEALGFEVVRLLPDASGRVPEKALFDAIDQNTVLVSMMAVNNETGAVMPIKAARAAIDAANAPALLHCDAVQAFGKMPLNVNALGVDMLSLSGHKIHAPKGVGALFVRKGARVLPFLLGGGQESAFRSGTEAVPAICGLGGAVAALPDMSAQLKQTRALWEHTANRLRDLGAVINSPEDALPFVLNFSLLGYRSETVLHFLESEGVFVSSGSACAKGEGSYVLRAMGLGRDRVDSALRISFSRFNTPADTDRLCEALCAAKDRLRKAKI